MNCHIYGKNFQDEVVVEPDIDLAAGKLREGYSFLAFGVDFLFIGEMCRGKLRNLREIIEG